MWQYADVLQWKHQNQVAVVFMHIHLLEQLSKTAEVANEAQPR